MCERNLKTMKLHDLIEQTYQTFQEEAESARVILLHPQSQYRSVLVAKLIQSTETKVFYYALGPDDINVQSFLTGLTHDLASQYPTFGRHLNILPSDEYANNLDAILETFAQDLTEMSEEPFFFILDEYDRSDSADDVQMFIERLVDLLPPNCRLVINSRTLPRLPWVSLIAQKKAILLKDTELIRSNFYNIRTEGENQLEVFALGPGYILMDEKPIDTWEGHLPRLLFFFALDRPSITRSEICQAFWPDLDTDQAVNVFHVTKRRLHKALNMDVLVHEDGYYYINPNLAVKYDVIGFVTALMAGRSEDNPDRHASWQKAVEMYRGPFLQGHNDTWIIKRRQDFLTGYLEALTEMARARLAEERPEHALSLFQKALSEDNTREDIHREIMQLYTKMGRRSEAAAHYQRLVDDLSRNNAKPTVETEKLYKEMMT